MQRHVLSPTHLDLDALDASRPRYMHSEALRFSEARPTGAYGRVRPVSLQKSMSAIFPYAQITQLTRRVGNDPDMPYATRRGG